MKFHFKDHHGTCGGTPLGQEPPRGGRPDDGHWFSLAVPSVPAVFQWLKQIEGTEAALTQKMLDLEKEKVKDMPRLWEGGVDRVQITHFLGRSYVCFVLICMHF